MSTVALKSQTIGAIRRFVSRGTSRDGLKGLLLEAGANADRILKLFVASNMTAAGYKSMSALLNEGFDTVYEDFEKPEADGILLRMASLILSRRRDNLPPEDVQALEQGLATSGLSIAQVTQATTTILPIDAASQQAEAAQLREASDLLAKGLRRLTTDRPGAITACTSAAESVCRVALERLGLPLPAGKQFPDYFNALCQQTNIEALARVSGEDSRKVFTSLRGLAQGAYQAAHQLGDRHAHGETAPEPSPFATDLLVISCAALTTLLAGALARNELKALNMPSPTS